MVERPIIAWIGGGYLDQKFEEYGYDIRRIRFFKPRVLNWAMVCEEIGCKPDVVIYVDASLPPPLAGVENFPCLTIFYCVDSHIHEWYPLYAQGFDLCAVSLLDHLPRMLLRLKKEHIFWLPPFPIRGERPPKSQPERIWDVLFVGHVDAETTPLRKKFLKDFMECGPALEVRKGKFSELFPRAKVILNIAERGDLNFRVFEALATGACLLTPIIGNGQDLLFEEGRHLFTYRQNDPRDAAEKAAHLVAHPEICEAARKEGLLLIDKQHRRRHRVKKFCRMIASVDKDEVVGKRLSQAGRIRELYLRLVYLHWAYVIHDPTTRQLYLNAAKGLC